MRRSGPILVCLALAGCAAIDRSSSPDAGGAGGAAAGDGATAGALQAGGASLGGVGGANDGLLDSGIEAAAGTTSNGSAGSGSTAASFILGADITWVQADIDAGATYVDGTQQDILQILKAHGFNYIRLRTFVDPTAPDGYDQEHGFADLDHTVAFGKLIKAAGMGFLLDFHYSDNWADPGKQCVPVAWQGLDNITQMASALHDYTATSINALIAAGARPDMVQIGNEITAGMDIQVCDPNGTPTAANAVSGSISSWQNLGALLSAGSKAIKEIDPTISVMLHLDRGNAFATSRDFIVNARAQGVVFDVFGESCYTTYQGQPADWTSTFDQLAAAFPDLKLVIAEYGAEQRAANDLLFNLPAEQGLGSFVWEPTHTGAWNVGHALFTADGNVNTATADLSLYDQMKRAYAARL